MGCLLCLYGRLTLGALWAVAGLSKLQSPAATRRTAEDLGLARGGAARFVGFFLPLAELALGTALLFGEALQVAAAVSLLLLLTFAAAMARALQAGRIVRCNCFGQHSAAAISWLSVARNLVLAGCALPVVLWPSQYFGVRRLAVGAGARGGEPAALDLIPTALVWLASVVGSLLVTSLWDAVSQLRRRDRAGAQPRGAVSRGRREMDVLPRRDEFLRNGG